MLENTHYTHEASWEMKGMKRQLKTKQLRLESRMNSASMYRIKSCPKSNGLSKQTCALTENQKTK